MSEPINVAIISAISAGVAVAITSALNLAAQAIERKHQRKAMLFKSAIEVAQKRTDFGLEVSKQTGYYLEIQDPIILADTYYKWLSHLFDKGCLPSDAIEAERKSKAELMARKALKQGRRAERIERTVLECCSDPFHASQLLATADLQGITLTEDQIKRLKETIANGDS